MAKSALTTLLIIALLLHFGCAAPTTKRPEPDEAAVALEAEKQREYALKMALGNQQRLNRVGWPILRAGLPLCIDRNRWAIGAFYANKYDFPKEMQDTAVARLAMGETLKVHTVIDASPAAQAGLTEGDVIIRVNDKPATVGKEASQKLSEMLKREMEEGREIALEIRRNNLPITLPVSPVQVCDYPLLVANEDHVNAYADGNNIVVFQGMMDFARTDEELSLVVAHELAHNNMRHIDAKKTNFFIGLLFDILVTGLTGVDVGIRNAAAMAYSKEFEAEADYVAMYIMARAEMDLDNAPDFWRRMGTRQPKAIEDNYLASHPSTPERFVALEDTIKEIKSKQVTGQALMPNIDDEARKNREPPPSQASKLGFGQ